ncbi:hypothetical protein FRC96_11435 [Lujinxingia vulgaris]|uniref:MACPF domain-containing protein n=1 Tax=Lujinxingia vulgaris TaxID=2600176 RepID=A0A5C6X0M3_9DELT|nr:hypothetical protein [Lujinxingia vulgaris]TXD35281.1 hypothetical protein FRC96_11435 [Lujinxingia vulgaris]
MRPSPWPLRALCLSMAAQAIACTNTPDVPADMPTRATHQVLEYSGAIQNNDAPLGSGLYRNDLAWHAAPAGVCLPEFFPRIFPQWSAPLIAGFLRSEQDVDWEISGALSVAMSDEADAIEALKARARAKLAAGDEGTRLLFMVSKITTAMRSVIPSREGGWPQGSNSRCAGDDAISDLEDFVSNCGTHYIDKETLGGYVVMLADITSLDERDVETLADYLQVQSPLSVDEELPPLSFDWAIDATTGSLLSDVPLDVYVYGLPSPPVARVHEQAWGTTDLKDWGRYIANLRRSVEEAIRQESIDSPDYGRRVDVDILEYTRTHLEDCEAVSESIHRELACVQELDTHEATLMGPNVLIDHTIAMYARMLENPHLIIWPNLGSGPEDAQALYRSAKEQLETCADTITRTQEACDARVNGDDSSPGASGTSVCEACAIPEGCSERDLSTLIESLPPLDSAALAGPLLIERLGSAREAIAGYRQMQCVLTGLGGRFAGGGEGVFLEAGTFHSSQHHWILHTYSQHDDPSQPIYSQYSCVRRDRFIGHDHSLWFTHGNLTLVDTRTRGDRIEYHGDLSNLVALSGIRGRLAGLGEGAEVHMPVDRLDWRIVASSQQGPLQASFMEFGLSSTYTGMHQLYHDPTTYMDVFTAHANPYGSSRPHVQTRMAPLNDALCYLTEVGGQFDGGAERIWMSKSEGFWMLNARAAAGKEVKASASCVYYDQRRQSL